MRQTAAGSETLAALAITPVGQRNQQSLESLAARTGAQRSTLAGPCEVADMIPFCPRSPADRQGLGERGVLTPRGPAGKKEIDRTRDARDLLSSSSRLRCGRPTRIFI